MPDRSVKMKRRILGFQRRVWWPKWTPASSSSRIEATAMSLFSLVVWTCTGGALAHVPQRYAPAPRLDPPGRGISGLAQCSEGRPEVVRQRRFDVDPLARERVVEGEPRRVEELALEPEDARASVRRVAGHRQV